MAVAVERERWAVCPSCGRTRRLSGRHARRSPLCGPCRKPAKVQSPTDSDRRFWLKQFTDEEIIDLAFGLFDQEGDITRVHSFRMLLLKGRFFE